MPRLVLCVLSAAISQLCFSISAAADDLAICLNKNISEQHIVACSNVINSQQFSGRNLALSYNNRGVAWWKIGASDQALADYDAAIRIMPSLFTAYANRCVVFTYRSEPDR